MKEQQKEQYPRVLEYVDAAALVLWRSVNM
jgi:uncharacterized protein YgfB (UPF0149 family)